MVFNVVTMADLASLCQASHFYFYAHLALSRPSVSPSTREVKWDAQVTQPCLEGRCLPPVPPPERRLSPTCVLSEGFTFSVCHLLICPHPVLPPPS